LSDFGFRLGGHDLIALARGGLWWPAERLLAVGDLHLGKALRLTRHGGGLLPPWEVDDTLERLDHLVRQVDPAEVICLGDSFDDLQASEDLETSARLWLLRLMAGRHWLWVEGNHDPGPLDLPGEHHAEIRRHGLTFRHIANPMEKNEISAHFHPKASIRVKGAAMTRPAFLIDRMRVILPALGSLTGGLASHDRTLAALMGEGAVAVLTGPRALPIPMPRT
jgi:uncharacterized protein